MGFCGWIGTIGLISESDDAFTPTVSTGEHGRADIPVSNVAGWVSSAERGVRLVRHATRHLQVSTRGAAIKIRQKLAWRSFNAWKGTRTINEQIASNRFLNISD